MAEYPGSYKELLKYVNDDSNHQMIGSNDAVVMVVGATGSGKTTLTQYLTGDISKLAAKGSGGNFLIVDENDRINRKGTILSQTIFPALTVDSLSNDRFWDLPGFQNTCNTSTDLLIAHFMRKVVKSCERIKLVFVVSHNAVQDGMDRSAFMDLVKHASAFVKDLPKYKDSIALVVTKIQNPTVKRNGVLEYVKDADIVENIARFLGNVKIEIASRNDRGEKCVLYQNAVKFIDILLQRDGYDGCYTRIGLFRAPDQAGPLSDIELLMNGKKSLERVVFNNLKFTLKNDEDFGFSVSDESRNRVIHSIEEFVEGAVPDLQAIVQSIEAHYQNLEKEKVMSELVYIFSEEADFWEKMLSKLNLPSETSAVLNVIIETFETLEFDIPKNRLSSLIKQRECLSCLEELCSKKFKIAIVQWTQLFIEIGQKVEDSKVWYKLLVRLHAHLSQYDYRTKDLDQFKTFERQIHDWVAEEKTIRGKDLKHFLDQIHVNDVKDGSSISVIQLRHLYDLIRVNLDDDIVTSEDGCLKIHNNYVRFSSIPNPIPEGVKCLEIFASIKLFIDCDLTCIGRKLQIVIIAPTWEVIGQNRKIDLNGELAGDFFGISKRIMSGNNLNITAEGRDNNGDISLIGLSGNTEKSLQNYEFEDEEEASAYSDVFDLGVTTSRKSTSFAHSINDYKKFFRENSVAFRALFPTNCFLNELNGSKEIRRMYDISALVHDFDGLEKQFHQLKVQIDCKPFYEELAFNIQQYAMRREGALQDKKILCFLYTATLSRISALNSDRLNHPLITDVGNYLKFSIKTIKKFKQHSAAAVLCETTNQYKSRFDQQIDEAQDFISTNLLSEIFAIGHDIDGKMEKLFLEVIELRNDIVQRQNCLIEKRMDLERISVAKIITESIKTIGSFLLNFIRFSKMIGNLVQRCNAVGIALRLNEVGAPISRGLHVLSKIESTAGIAHEFIEAFRLDQTEQQNNNAAIALRSQNGPMMNFIEDLYRKLSGNADRISLIDEELEILISGLNKLTSYQANITEILVPFWKNVQSEMDRLTTSIEGKSHVTLDIAKWNVYTTVDKLKFSLFEIIKNPSISVSFGYPIEKLVKTMDLVLGINDRIQDYHDQKQLVDYLECVSSKSCDEIMLHDPQLKLALNKLKVRITSNVVIGQYDRILNGLKGIVFPFGEQHYFGDLALPIESSSETLLPQIITKLETLNSMWIESDLTINPAIDSRIHVGQFYSDPRISLLGPFYEWKNSDFRNEIINLFAGKEIVLNADILRNSKYNAVKFNQIDLCIGLSEPQLEHELDECLKNFVISLTHMGNSYYKFDRKIYMITSDSQTIRQSFAKQPCGGSQIKNIVYDKLQKSKCMLSPFTMWKLKLESISENEDFHIFDKFTPFISLELSGSGSFVVSDANISTDKLDKFYTVCDCLS